MEKQGTLEAINTIAFSLSTPSEEKLELIKRILVDAPTSVFDYSYAELPELCLPMSFSKFPLTSHCGQRSKEAIDTIVNMKETIDGIPDEVIDYLRKYLKLVCFG